MDNVAAVFLGLPCRRKRLEWRMRLLKVRARWPSPATRAADDIAGELAQFLRNDCNTIKSVQASATVQSWVIILAILNAGHQVANCPVSQPFTGMGELLLARPLLRVKKSKSSPGQEPIDMMVSGPGRSCTHVHIYIEARLMRIRPKLTPQKRRQGPLFDERAGGDAFR